MTLSIAHRPLPVSDLPRQAPRTAPAEDPARIRATVARAPLFASLPIDAIEDLARRAQVRRAAAHTTVVNQDEPGDTLFVIMTGRIKAVIFGESGREVTLSLLRPGDAFGELSVLDNRPRSASCVAIEASTLLVLSRADLLDHISAYPRTALNLLDQMAQRLRRADETIAELALCDVSERLVRRICALAREEGKPVPEGVLVRRRPTQQELANMIGSCRETISRAFNQLAREGMILPRGRALIVTPALMARTENARAA